MNVLHAIQTYLDWKRSYAPHAAAMYAPRLVRFFRAVGKPLESVTLEDIVRYQGEQGRGRSQSTVAYVTLILRNFFTFWHRQGIACVNPMLIRVPRFVARSHEALSETDFTRMDGRVGEDDLLELTKKLVINFLWETGVRVSELCDLNLDDLDMAGRSARVVTKKSNVVRWVFWTDRSHRLFVKYLGVRLCLNGCPHVFACPCHGSRQRLSPRTVQKWVKQLCARAGVERKISPHSFRHAKAHRILEMGGNVADIAKILGHSDRNPIAAFNYLKLSKLEVEVRAKKYL